MNTRPAITARESKQLVPAVNGLAVVSSVATVPNRDGVLEMPHYCLGPQDAETKDQVWIAAPSEKEARRSVLYHEPDALDPEKWFCRHDATRSPPPGVILTGGGRTITMATSR